MKLKNFKKSKKNLEVKIFLFKNSLFWYGVVITDPFLVTVRIKIFWKKSFFFNGTSLLQNKFFLSNLQTNQNGLRMDAVNLFIYFTATEKFSQKTTTWEFKKIKFKMYLIWCFKNQILICGGSRSTSWLYNWFLENMLKVVNLYFN